MGASCAEEAPGAELSVYSGFPLCRAGMRRGLDLEGYGGFADDAHCPVRDSLAVRCGAVCPGTALSSFDIGRTRQLLAVLGSLMLPRVAPSGGALSGGGAPSRRPVYLPKVTPGQRAILDFLHEELCSGWQVALRLLAKYSVGGAGSEGGGTGGGSVVTVECAKEAAATLSGMMSSQVPKKDRALALEALLQEVGALGVCVGVAEACCEVCRAWGCACDWRDGRSAVRRDWRRETLGDT